MTLELTDDLSHALLGFLSIGSLSGYDLKKQSEATIQHFWHFNLSQIYPALNNLLAQGFITQSIEQKGKKARKIYAITPLGQKQLLDWLAHAHQPEQKKLPFLLKLYFSQQEKNIFKAHCLRYWQENKKKIAHLRTLHMQYHKAEGQQENPFHWAALETIDFGIHMAKAKMAWIQDKYPEIDGKDPGDLS